MEAVKCFHALINPPMVLEELPLLSGSLTIKVLVPIVLF